MKTFIGFIITLVCLSVQAQDSSYSYAGWGKPGSGQAVPLKVLKDKSFTQVILTDENPVLIKRFDEKHALHEHIENEYDEYGNHLSSKLFDATGRLREESKFQNDPTEMALFRTIFGNTFVPANSNFMIRREYNEFERETGYFIVGVMGQTLFSRVTLYREDRRKDHEILRDDLADKILTERRYKYIDSENRTVLEEFDGTGKMVQRVVLFDHHDIIQE
ncbi:MAG: hypothetical protein HOB84_15975 [Candidatus Marinimicrobia bacterium]|jgi:hypothetical protein|nr:hypothetical protein [Candidatus Neomarinimicrobiota bacterium]MBT4716265.1 hypothetical protein [Candidatus Neomarinimicrobiota bacterium]MBT4945273.1 hypothetical protein [Candidatus Neomarinimicrobiota bacterium]MBT5269187.1 hypothetical protein [Candidatus Neomarinimicrobiota bacterium]MBT6012971.1 hypothetical protein [Candidatus Neomarinimicrobiota bacterium]